METEKKETNENLGTKATITEIQNVLPGLNSTLLMIEGSQ